MRYLIQFVIPVSIFLLVAWGVLSRRKRRSESSEEGDGTGVFLVILAIGAAVAIALFMVLGDWLDAS